MFNNITVLDFTRVFSGPFCTQMLAELGADVIKVEEPTRGDETRGWYPVEKGWSGYFMALNRSKKSLTLNLKDEKAKEIIKEIVKTCDVVVENFAPGVAERLGISYEDLKKIKPDIIYLSLSAYGQNGPNRKVKGYDPIIQADAGVMSLTGERGGEPVKTMFPIADISSSLYGAFAVASALYKRAMTQEGEYIDIALYDSVVSLMGILAAIPFFKNEVPERLGSEHPHRVPSRNYQTSDGTYIHVICNESQWLILCEVLQLDEKYKREPYTIDLGRLERREEIDKLVQDALLTKPGSEWMDILQEAGVPCALVNSLDQVLKSEQTKSRELLINWAQDNLGEAVGLNFPYKFANAKSKVTRPVPKLGEHTEDILEQFGYTSMQINELKKNGTI
ncbi:CaiB/BaiF CoA transferase family protein [Anaerobacillus sp. MEB173]|uniref:CaiB/BaiF CoA transferase family protein n=1 Tax=Anaerobacillus sp. MEB173 TaxID=3383345 RepID=UPI003F8DC39E